MGIIIRMLAVVRGLSGVLFQNGPVTAREEIVQYILSGIETIPLYGVRLKERTNPSMAFLKKNRTIKAD